MDRAVVAVAVMLALTASGSVASAASSSTVTVTVAGEEKTMDWTGQWTRMQIADASGVLQPAPEPDKVKFEVDPGLSVSMSVGCNQIGSQLQPGEGGALTFAPGMATRMACMGPVGEAEDRLTAALGVISRYEARGGDIAFLDADGKVVLEIGR